MMTLSVEKVLEGITIPTGAPVTTTVDGEHSVSAECMARGLMASLDDVATARERLGTLILLLAGGRCPRCREILDEVSTGSGVTDCRCIPVCSNCAVEESTDFRDISEWPVDTGATESKPRREVEVAAFPTPELAGTDQAPVVETPPAEATSAEEPEWKSLWPLAEDGGGGPRVDSVEDATEQVLHYKGIASLRKKSLEAAILRIYELEAVIRDLGGTPPPWDEGAEANDEDAG